MSSIESTPDSSHGRLDGCVGNIVYVDGRRAGEFADDGQLVLQLVEAGRREPPGGSDETRNAHSVLYAGAIDHARLQNSPLRTEFLFYGFFSHSLTLEIARDDFYGEVILHPNALI